jgi:hypothetical protein
VAPGYSGHRYAVAIVSLYLCPLAGCMFVRWGPGGALASHFLCHDAWGMWGQS